MEMDVDRKINNFELVLKGYSAKKSLLYRDKNVQGTGDGLTSVDVIKNISEQIKAINNDETLKNSSTNKYTNDKLKAYKKPNFMPVNMLSQEQLQNPGMSVNFDTQYVFDTQLLTAIKDAEAIIDTNTGVTQEFETSFDQTLDCKITHDTEVVNANKKEKRSIKIESNRSSNSSADPKEDLVSQNKSSKQLFSENDNYLGDDKQCQRKNNSSNENIQRNNSVDVPDDLKICIVNVSQSKDGSLSPIINPKKSKYVQKSPTNTYMLDSFEKFEAIAGPIIQENSNLEEAKRIINSNILNNELFIPDHRVDFLHDEKNEPLSPILKIKTEIAVSEKANNSLVIPDELIEEEILFSSDEETDYIDNQIKELPLTCALETSFYKQEDVLDKTMYVGFQTASNKSIQVLANSFSKAKSILNDVNDNSKKPSESFSLSELVEVYDSCLKPKKSEPEDICMEQIDNVCQKLDKKNIANEIQVGFKTARGKSINISENAWHKSKMIFNDIDKNSDDEKAKISAIIDGENFNENPEYSNKTIREVSEKEILIQTDRTAFCTSNNQGQIDIDDCIMQEFEESLVCINDNKLHTNFDVLNHSLKINNKECNLFQPAEKNHTYTQQCEFTTATNKKNKLSEEGMNKMKNIVKDIDLDIIHNHTEVNKKSNNMLQEIDFQNYLIKGFIDDTKCEEHCKKIIHNEKEGFFEGFKTAFNNPVNISNEALAKSKNILQEFDFQSDLTDANMDKAKNYKPISEDIHNDKKGFFQGFKTASNNPIYISKEALAKSNKLLQDFDFHSDLKDDAEDEAKSYKQISKNIIHNDKKELFQGFRTASNNPITISDEALAKSNKILQSDFADYMNRAECYKQISKNIIHNDKLELFQGFRTASNNPINISEEAFAKSNKILQDFDFHSDLTDDAKDEANCYKQISKNIVHNDQKKLFQGFRTAFNNPINIPKEALAKSNKILQSDFADDRNKARCYKQISKNIIQNDEKQYFQGFKTASYNPIHISEEALAKSDRILQEFDFQSDLTDDIDKTKCYKQISKSVTHNGKTGFLQGFKTASNSSIHISKEALAKSNKILQEFDFQSDLTDDDMNGKKNSRDISLDGRDNLDNSEICNELNVKEITALKFQGFKTANNDYVKISEEALAKSKKILQDIDGENVLPDKKNFKSTNFKTIGFQTANNKNVNISEKALLESKKIFEEGISKKSKYDCTPRQSIKGPNNNNTQMCDINLETRELLAKDYEKTSHKKFKSNDFDTILNTEMILDFEETMYTEDFSNKSPGSKRSGSPILSCPTAKKVKVKSIADKEIKSVDQHIGKTSQYAFNTNYKKYKKYKLLDIHQIENESDKLESYQDIHFNIDSILNYEFDGARNEISNVKWTTDNIKKYFLDSVNKKIIPEGWVDNHMKLIILKLYSYEKRFPNTMRHACSVKNVMEQLKYRYERELYNVERPALRKILEKDEVSCRRMVLRVLNIYVDGVSIANTVNLTENIELLLSDGWYCVKTSIDKMLVKLVCDRKIVVGTKLITQGAELLNCEQGVAPWENTSSVRLKIFGNSTRRAHWTARLGFHGNGAILSYLTAVKPEGGKISQLRVVVTRVYPMLYVEKFDDGSTVTRSERLENLYQMKYETEREILLEKVYEEVEKDFSNQDSQDCDSMYIDRKSLESGSQIYQLMKKSRDPVEFTANLTLSQAKLLQEYTIKRNEIFLQNLQSKVQDLLKKRGLNVVRNVVPMLKIRVADVYKTNITKAVITVWRPNESLLDIFQEGSWVDIFNVVATSVRYSEIQISAGKQSVFRKASKVNDQMAHTAKTCQRKCYMIQELTQNPYMTTDYNEVDTVGFVFDIEPSVKEFDSKKQLFQNVFLADANKKIICINFWGGLKKFGFENILETEYVVACVNLQKRSGNTRKNIPQYRATEFTYFTKTPKIDSSRKICDDLSKQFLSLDRRKFIQDCILIRNNFVSIKYGNIENISPYRFNNSDYNLSKNKAFINSPIGDVNLNLSGLDFESTFKQTDTVLSPKILLRKKEINEKIARLKQYGEPPPLSSIYIVNKNKDAAKPYKSPLISKNDPNATNQLNLKRENPTTVSKPLILNAETTPNAANQHLNVASDETKSSNNRCTSPVLPYRCRTFNPVKLNFSKQNDVSKDDPFGEDFESSPPLSLD